TPISPWLASSRRIRSGSLPLRNSCGPGTKAMRQSPSAAASVPAAPAAAAPSAAGAWPPASSASSPARAAPSAGAPPAPPCEQAAQHVHRGQQRADRVAVERPAAAADLVEQGLEHVGQVGDRGEAEGGGAALDRVRRAEDDVDRLGVGPARLERQQAALHRVQALAALLEECGVEAGDVHAQARTLRTVATSCSGSNGLTSQPVAPAALPSIFLSAPDSVV